MAFVTGQRLTADLLNQNLQGTTTVVVADTATSSTTETVWATFTGSVVLGQSYEIIAYFSIRTTVANDISLSRIREDSLVGNQLQGVDIPLITTATGGNAAYVRAEYTAVSTTTKTFVLTSVRNGGTGVQNLKASSSSPGYFRVQPLVN